MNNIKRTRNRYIIPFLFNENDFDNTINRIIDTNSWMILDMHVDSLERDLYNTILDSFEMNARKSNIGCALSYCGDKAAYETISYSRFHKELEFTIKDIGLFLFRTGLGFLWYEISLPEQIALEELTLFQNEFKELSYERFTKKDKNTGRFTFENKKTGDYFLAGEWVNRMLDTMDINYSFFASRKNSVLEKNVCDKALIFTYTVLNDIDKEMLLDGIYQLTNGYNNRYKRSKDFSSYLIEPFDNAYYYASMGGCGYFAIPQEDNNNFYTKTMYKKIMTDYFVLYVLVLYQMYTILKFTKDMEYTLSADVNNYLENSEEILPVLKNLETKINVFLIKSIYSSVSHISHQNDYYNYVVKRLHVRENIDDLTVGLESLHKLQETREKERIEELENQENQERELSDDRLNIGLGMISILAIISAIADGFGSADSFVEFLNLPEYTRGIINTVILTIIAIVAFVALTSIGPSLRRLRKKRRMIKQEKKKAKETEKR